MNQTQKISDPCVMVIFGATGDLTKRKLFPALYNLAKEKFLPENFAVVGVGRQEFTVEEFRAKIKSDLKEFIINSLDKKLIDWFIERTYYVGGDFSEDKTFKNLQKTLAEVAENHDAPRNYFFYLATPPSLFAPVVQEVCKMGMCSEENGWRRFIFEKPFGRDLESAKKLNEELGKILHESQIYRIDHYLGKETVQNILVFRFGNSIFEPIWNRNYIDHIQMTVAEGFGSRTARRILQYRRGFARYGSESYFSVNYINNDGTAGFV